MAPPRRKLLARFLAAMNAVSPRPTTPPTCEQPSSSGEATAISTSSIPTAAKTKTKTIDESQILTPPPSPSLPMNVPSPVKSNAATTSLCSHCHGHGYLADDSPCFNCPGPSFSTLRPPSATISTTTTYLSPTLLPSSAFVYSASAPPNCPLHKSSEGVIASSLCPRSLLANRSGTVTAIIDCLDGHDADEESDDEEARGRRRQRRERLAKRRLVRAVEVEA